MTLRDDITNVITRQSGWTVYRQGDNTPTQFPVAYCAWAGMDRRGSGWRHRVELVVIAEFALDADAEQALIPLVDTIVPILDGQPNMLVESVSGAETYDLEDGTPVPYISCRIRIREI